jgi:Fe2+ transport system protein FeoA
MGQNGEGYCHLQELCPHNPGRMQSLDHCVAASGPLLVTGVLGEDAEARRLCELGICIGRLVRVIRAGNPAIVDIDGGRFAMTSDLQARILVEATAE